jgi:hypothetical protein
MGISMLDGAWMRDYPHSPSFGSLILSRRRVAASANVKLAARDITMNSSQFSYALERCGDENT